jgi:hypothetical protein
MLVAHDINGKKILPIKNTKAFCPFCSQDVIPCFSQLGKSDYWRHKIDYKDLCLSYQYKNEGEWHSSTKLSWGIEYTEIYITKGNIKRRADVMLENKLVIEIQNSPIGVYEIKNREIFYGKIVWLFNGIDAYNNNRIKINNKQYEWRNPRESIIKCNAPVFIALSENKIMQILNIESLYYQPDNSWRKILFYEGQCKIMNFQEFRNHMIFTDFNWRKISYPLNWKKEFNNQNNTIQLEIF